MVDASDQRWIAGADVLDRLVGEAATRGAAAIEVVRDRPPLPPRWLHWRPPRAAPLACRHMRAPFGLARARFAAELRHEFAHLSPAVHLRL